MAFALVDRTVARGRRHWIEKHNRTTRNGVGNCSSTPKRKKTILKHFLKGISKGKLLAAPKLRKSADKSLLQPWCSHSNAICEIQLQKTIVLRMQLRHQATLTQPLQCDLQPQVQETNRTTHTGTTTRCRTQRRNPLSRTCSTKEVPFIAGCSHFTRKNARFRAPASFPTQAPCNIHAAITMDCVGSRSKPASLYAHGNTRRQQSCSHSNAICNHRFKKRIELRTQEQPLVAEDRGGTYYGRNDRSRTRRTQEVPFIAGCSHFTRENARFRAPASSLTQAPCNIHAAITMDCVGSRSKPPSLYAHGNTRRQQSCSHSNAICNHRFKKRIELRRTQRRNPLRSERPQPQLPRRYLSSPAAATLHGKMHGFVLRLPP